MTHPLTAPRGYTLEDLAALPEHVHAEIVNGSLVINAAPSRPHNRIGWRLAALLDEYAPEGVAITTGVDLVVQPSAPTRTRRPDVVAYAASVDETGEALTPAAVRLLVEIVSPESQERDRLIKPAEYARIGIPAYWVIETDPVAVVEYRLIGTTYVPGQPVTDVFTTQWPWPIEFSIKDLGR